MSSRIVFNPRGNPDSLLHNVNDTIHTMKTDYVTSPAFIDSFRNQSKDTPAAADHPAYRNFQPGASNIYGMSRTTQTTNHFTSNDNHGWFVVDGDAISGVQLQKQSWTL